MKKDKTIQIILLILFFIYISTPVFPIDINTLKEKAEQGDAKSQWELGVLYEYGEGVPQNWSEAVKWFRKAAEKGNATAQYKLGWCFHYGKGALQSWNEAAKWFRKAAEQGNAEAQYYLGWCYRDGKGVPQSYEEAFKWYQRGAEQGESRAQCFLGWCYENGKGVQKNTDEAVKWYWKAAEQGNGLAQYNLKRFENLTLAQVQTQMLTWDQYYKNNRKITPKFEDEEEIKKAIQADVERWQEKGEFETTHAWKERVNDKTRNEFIRITTNDYVAQYNRDISNLRSEQEQLAKEYEAYRKEKMNSFYEYKVSQSVANFNASDFELKPYDADHETFLIHSNNYGDILLPVPISEAPSFKQNWNSIKTNIRPEFVPNGEDVALSKLTFKNNTESYVYDSHTKANYAITDVKYNFAPIEIADINVASLQMEGISEIPEGITSKMFGKTSSDVLTAQKANIERVSVSASEKSDVDISIPQNNADNNTTTFAVIIANEEYHSVSRVPYASRDGEVLEKYLTKAVGLPKDHVRTYKNASFGNMAAALKHVENLSEAFGKDLNLIFYYAGHGMPNEKTKNPMLIPVDGDAAIPETCYELNKIITSLGNINANSVVVMLDACFSGTERGEGMLMAARGIRIKSNQSEPIGNMVILSASQGDETAYPFDTEQHGLFTYFLLKKLQENKGDVTLGELSDYIIEQVKRQSVVSNGKLQTPTISVSPSFQTSWRNLKLK